MQIIKAFLFNILLLAVLSGCANNIFYPAERAWSQTPDELGYRYRNHFLSMPDGAQINVWQLPGVGASRGAILYFHGNTQNISRHISQIAWLVDAGFDVVMVDYRGFGASSGKLSLAKTADDMHQVMLWFLSQYPEQETWLLGQSLGAALSIHVAGSDKSLSQAFNGFIFDSGFASFQAIGQDVFSRAWFTWGLQLPLSWLMPKGFDAKNVIANFSPRPILLLHGVEDYVVPYHHAETLLAAAKESKSLVSYYARHIQGFANLAIREQVLAFIGTSGGSVYDK